MTSRVILVDDHELIREGLRRAFERQGFFEVVGAAGTLREARQLFESQVPDVVVTDVRLPDGTGLDLVCDFRQKRPDVGIVVLTMFAGDETLFAALQSGASAFVSKDAPSAEVVAAARQAALSPGSFTAKNFSAAMRRRREDRSPALTEREQDVLRLLSDGLSVSVIAENLYISPSTAKTHIAKIYEKLGVANRAQALVTAIRNGLLPDHAPE